MLEQTRISEWFVNDGEYVPQVGSDVNLCEMWYVENLHLRFVDALGFAIDIRLSDNDLDRLINYITESGKLPRFQLVEATKLSEWFLIEQVVFGFVPEPEITVLMLPLETKKGERLSADLMHPENIEKLFFVVRFAAATEAIEILLSKHDADRIVAYVTNKRDLELLFARGGNDAV